MKASDFAAPQPQTFAVDPKLMARNAKATSQTDWRGTHIAVGEGAAESAPYGRDAAIAKFAGRKFLHAVLDNAMSHANMDQSASHRLHAALDRALDEGLFNNAVTNAIAQGYNAGFQGEEGDQGERNDPNLALHEPEAELDEEQPEASEEPLPPRPGFRRRIHDLLDEILADDKQRAQVSKDRSVAHDRKPATGIALTKQRIIDFWAKQGICLVSGRIKD
ncbi:MAG: hypothetical protein ABR953_11600 [Candidatus Acidiferrales bacterium]|jgi:hypothetical protein